MRLGIIAILVFLEIGAWAMDVGRPTLSDFAEASKVALVLNSQLAPKTIKGTTKITFETEILAQYVGKTSGSELNFSQDEVSLFGPTNFFASGIQIVAYSDGVKKSISPMWSPVSIEAKKEDLLLADWVVLVSSDQIQSEESFVPSKEIKNAVESVWSYQVKYKVVKSLKGTGDLKSISLSFAQKNLSPTRRVENPHAAILFLRKKGASYELVSDAAFALLELP